MELLFFDWDYFPFSGFVGAKLLERQLRRLCRERSDGNLNYFPRGFGEPGFQVDKSFPAEAAAALATPNKPVVWFLAPLPFVYLLIDRPATVLATFVNGLAGGALLSAFLLPFSRSFRLWGLRRTLCNSPARVAELSVQERRTRNLQLWHQTSAPTHCVEFLCLGLVAGFAAWVTKLIFSEDLSALVCASAWVPIAAIGYAVITILRYAELALVSAIKKAPAT